MIPVKQTVMGVNGNCFQAAVASILEVDIDEIEITQGDDWFEKFCEFIKCKFGLTYVEFEVKELKEGMFRSGDNDVYHIIIMASCRLENDDHAVVGKNGVPFFDPVTSDIVAVGGYPHGENGYLIGLFLKQDM